MWVYIGYSSHLDSMNMFAHLWPTHFLRYLWESQLQKIKEWIKFGKKIFDDMHKPRLSLNLNKITQKEKKKRKNALQSLPCLLHSIFWLFPCISGKLLNKNTTF